MALCENDIFSSFVKVEFGYAATTRRFSASIGKENNFSSRVANVGVASPRSGQSGGGGSHYYWGATATSDDQYLPSELSIRRRKTMVPIRLSLTLVTIRAKFSRKTAKICLRSPSHFSSAPVRGSMINPDGLFRTAI
jgi:hypothetical protein